MSFCEGRDAGENGDSACPSVKGGMPSEHRERREDLGTLVREGSCRAECVCTGPLFPVLLMCWHGIRIKHI